jgi:hypothetical protein
VRGRNDHVSGCSHNGLEVAGRTARNVNKVKVALLCGPQIAKLKLFMLKMRHATKPRGLLSVSSDTYFVLYTSAY